MNLSAEDAQLWVTIIGTLATVLVTVLTFIRSQNRRDVRAAVGASFTSTVEALSSDNDTTRMAGAVLLRRFFDRQTEQGTRGTPYVKEAIELIAGMLREELPPRIQKVLADGLRYARDLQRADLQHCNLANTYPGWKSDDDRGVNLTGAKFAGAQIGGADFAGAKGIPPEVAELLDTEQKAPEDAVVPTIETRRPLRLPATRRRARGRVRPRHVDRTTGGHVPRGTVPGHRRAVVVDDHRSGPSLSGLLSRRPGRAIPAP